MGRQINFYMDTQTKMRFHRFMVDNGFIFIADKVDKELQYINDDEINNFYCICLYKSEFGKIIKTKIDLSEEGYIDKGHNPIIEYWPSRLELSEKKIVVGRLWLTSDTLFDLNSDRTIINMSYSRLVRWIKKEVPYQNVNGFRLKRYISDSLVDLVYKENYTLK